MAWMRARILEGFPSMTTADLHIQARASKGPPVKQSAPVVIPRRLLDRPPFMPDDDPLIGKVYK